MAEAGLGGHEWKVWAANFFVHALVAAVAYAVLVRRIPLDQPGTGDPNPSPPPLDRVQRGTIVIISSWVAAVVGLNAPIGLAAFAAAAVVIAARLADERAALKAMPWAAIIMVCGVSMLVTMRNEAAGCSCSRRCSRGWRHRPP